MQTMNALNGVALMQIVLARANAVLMADAKKVGGPAVPAIVRSPSGPISLGSSSRTLLGAAELEQNGNPHEEGKIF